MTTTYAKLPIPDHAFDALIDALIKCGDDYLLRHTTRERDGKVISIEWGGEVSLVREEPTDTPKENHE